MHTIAEYGGADGDATTSASRSGSASSPTCKSGILCSNCVYQGCLLWLSQLKPAVFRRTPVTDCCCRPRTSHTHTHPCWTALLLAEAALLFTAKRVTPCIMIPSTWTFGLSTASDMVLLVCTGASGATMALLRVTRFAPAALKAFLCF